MRDQRKGRKRNCIFGKKDTVSEQDCITNTYYTKSYMSRNIESLKTKGKIEESEQKF